MVDWSLLAWPCSRLGEAMSTLARRRGLAPRPVSPPAYSLGPEQEGRLGEQIVSTALYLGIEAKPVDCTYRSLRKLLLTSAPSLIRLPGAGGARFLVLLRRSSGKVVLLGTDLLGHAVPVDILHQVLCQEIESPVAEGVERLLDRVGLSRRRRAKARSTMVSEHLSQARVGECWLLRLRPGAGFWNQAREARLPQSLVAFSSAYTVQYMLWILSWWMIGRGALEGRLDWGWVLAWALLLLTVLPFSLMSSWYQGLIAIDSGGLLKRRLLQGALRLEPDEIRHQGAGHHLGRVLESEAVESLALSGGFLVLVGVIEIVVAAVILTLGAGGAYHGLLLCGWLGLTSLIGRRYLLQRRAWAGARLGISHELIEKMVGHRTRLAQKSPDQWHEGEDQTLARYLESSAAMDRTEALMSALPRGWLAMGLFGLAPAFISGQAGLALLAVGLGGMLLAYRASVKLVDGIAFLADAAIAWKQVAPLFHSAAREAVPGDPSLNATFPQPKTVHSPQRTKRDSHGEVILDVSDLVFRYPERGEPVLRGLSFQINSGDRVLLQSPSGGGKSTLVSLINGLRAPDSGLLLFRGLDRLSLGAEGWTRRVASAPQFHENHVITETFAFNLLMGRGWPPRPEDLEEAETLCRELGLGELIDRMPAGMLQMVGETGWQLSHGEKSRLFLARALLQGAELVVLDESFAALDPDSLSRALRSALNHAPSLLLIAHP